MKIKCNKNNYKYVCFCVFTCVIYNKYNYYNIDNCNMRYFVKERIQKKMVRGSAISKTTFILGIRVLQKFKKC